MHVSFIAAQLHANCAGDALNRPPAYVDKPIAGSVSSRTMLWFR